jgi:hypothetical protein
MVGCRTPTADGSDAGVAQALKARIEKLKRYLTQGSLTKLVEFRRDPFIAILVAGKYAIHKSHAIQGLGLMAKSLGWIFQGSNRS